MQKLNKMITAFTLCAGLILFSTASQNEVEVDSKAYATGKALYKQGILPNGELVKATIQGDISVEGDQLICETCHRKSGLGSTEGQQVVPAVAGSVLFKPLKLPTSKPPEPPVYREAYTRETLMAAIRDGVDANGYPLDPFMPRYQIDEQALDGLMAYVSTLSNTPSPGVDEETIHFATIVLSSNKAEENKALIDVMETYVEQKNIETRYETKRAKNAPWHKEWMFKPYRKWQIHVWELTGDEASWPEQLSTYYTKQPVFALVNGLVPTGWSRVSEFCEGHGIPCLFPTTQQPVISDENYYTIYLNKGASHESEAVASYIRKNRPAARVVQIHDESDMLSSISSNALIDELNKAGISVDSVALGQLGDKTASDFRISKDDTVVLWLDRGKSEQLFNSGQLNSAELIMLSSQYYGTDTKLIPQDLTDSVLFIHSAEMPDKLNRLLIRSTGWFRAKRIYNKETKEIQANAYFSLKVLGDAVKHIRGYFYRDYMIEKIEHMIDDLPYTSIFPRLSMAPDQRFASRGFYVAKTDGKGGITNLTGWIAP
ncbi:MAG: ABC transporter substrate-binding protein [Candidatus Thiodiazotropha sp. (ex. Lucinisca nassula)]|nr:ABC transporter substrate-binding protein [Candidatus Thiodiazotropha sp. (ex. Lucinisca nassula)]MBW9271563.1 ABC transporter substrate-binding protein [Candidatus Thiodiazotropha sp. (ex. Lucinisca nassula)]